MVFVIVSKQFCFVISFLNVMILILSVGYSDRSKNSFVSYLFNMVWGSSESVRVILFLNLRLYFPYTVHFIFSIFGGFEEINKSTRIIMHSLLVLCSFFFFRWMAFVMKSIDARGST